MLFGKSNLRERVPAAPLIGIVSGAVFAIAACASPATSHDAERQTSESRNLQPFGSLDASNSISVRARIGSPQSVIVRAQAEALPHVLTTVSDGRLAITLDRTANGIRNVDVEIVSPYLVAVEADTAAIVRIDGLSAESFKVVVSDSASVSANGSVAQLDLRSATAAHLALADLRVKTAQVDVGTASVAEIAARESVLGTVHESGHLRILGDPGRVDVQQSTSGEVTRG